jgi:hypothetical protein
LTGPVGPRGLTVLVVVGIAGLLLAFIGWSQRGTGVIPAHSGQHAVYVVSIGPSR